MTEEEYKIKLTKAGIIPEHRYDLDHAVELAVAINNTDKVKKLKKLGIFDLVIKDLRQTAKRLYKSGIITRDLYKRELSSYKRLESNPRKKMPAKKKKATKRKTAKRKVSKRKVSKRKNPKRKVAKKKVTKRSNKKKTTKKKAAKKKTAKRTLGF